MQNRMQNTLAKKQQSEFFPHILARHQSLLLRKLGDTDMQLQRNKIENLRIAIATINGLVIAPKETFSLWERVGFANSKKGYKEGLLLQDGRPIRGVGGGLCQLSNLLHWLFLHTPMTITERYHHSVDAFPDSGRTLPFATGATVYYNYMDLQIKNNSKTPIQFHLWLTDTKLKGRIMSPIARTKKYSIEERKHLFVEHKGAWWRYNQIWRKTYWDGDLLNEEFLWENISPVRYIVDEQTLQNHGIKTLKI